MTQELHEKYIHSVKEIYESNFQCFESAKEVNQFLWGELYFYIDSMISITMHLNKSDYPMIYEMMQEILILITLWLRLFSKEFLKSFLLCWKYPYLYLVDKQAALANAGFELIDILKKIFGGCPWTLNFYDFKPEMYLFKGDDGIPWKEHIGRGF